MCRHGRQPVSEVAAMTLRELHEFAVALGEIIRLEGPEQDQ